MRPSLAALDAAIDAAWTNGTNDQHDAPACQRVVDLLFAFKATGKPVARKGERAWDVDELLRRWGASEREITHGARLSR